MKKLLQRAARSLNLELLSSWQLDDLALSRHLRSLLSHYQITQIVEVGTNSGAYGEFLRREVDFQVAIFSFEYDPEAYAKLKSRSNSDALWQCSAFDINNLMREGGHLDGQALALSISELPKARRMLKLDNGDRDPAILNAVPNILEDVHCLQIETQFRSHQESATDLALRIKDFESLGFRLSGLFPITLDKDQCVSSFDCVLIRKPS